MKTIFIILFGIACLIYIGKPTINFSPFSISFERPYLLFAVLFLGLSIAFYSIQYEKIGYKNGVEDSVKVIEEAFNDKVE
jgi:hypothetical protein